MKTTGKMPRCPYCERPIEDVHQTLMVGLYAGIWKKVLPPGYQGPGVAPETMRVYHQHCGKKFLGISPYGNDGIWGEFEL